MYTAQKNNKKLKALYDQSLHIKSAIPHPVILGVIRECGGKMHLREMEFEKAHTDFFEAFKAGLNFVQPAFFLIFEFSNYSNFCCQSFTDQKRSAIA